MAAGNRKRRERPRFDTDPRRGDKRAPNCPETGKDSYRGEAAALTAAAGAASNYGHPMRAYLCPFCGYFHLTSQPATPRRDSPSPGKAA